MAKDMHIEDDQEVGISRRSYETLQLAGEAESSGKFEDDSEKNGWDRPSYRSHWESFKSKHPTLRKVPWHGIATGVLLVTSLIFVTGWSVCSSEPEEYAKFLVVGDWGRQGQYNQTLVAQRMNKIADKIDADFIISTGDNFYPSGLRSTDDPLFAASFSDVYTGKHLRVPWFSVLGNHDYGDQSTLTCAADNSCTSPLHQLDVKLAARDERWFAARSFQRSFGNGQLDIFFIDTNPAVAKYRAAPWAQLQGGLSVQSWEAQLRELEAGLAASKARWRIVVGHHPVRSNGMHGDTAELVAQLEPILQKYRVQAYFAGHDHSLEHIHQKGAGNVHYVISGAGSQCDREFAGTTDSLFQHPYSGFVAVEIDHEEMDIDFYGIEESSKPIYSMEFDLTDFKKRTELWSAEGL